MARNPATGAAVKVKKTAVPAFRAGAEFKAITSGAKKVAKAPAKKAAAKKAPAKKAAGQEGAREEGRREEERPLRRLAAPQPAPHGEPAVGAKLVRRSRG